ncbi:RaxX family RiPP [Xanthomonas oryzae pv. oryzicola]|uniref:RaxX family RiPP n=1 Tax=Xanthomonas oryzae TaxID=347 RepID=UPI00096CF217|nr:RaxX family RiPP [Xanthomonas oryzae]MEC5078582.1 RaxX family RiPP [Xanthomonas oryzae pv. oryzicola]MEC5113141.1 RaxX family RiPP [Xanthomonas oryzae pv. oryzicola]OWB30595.1 hypothetical protein XocBAI15_01525 [Xanthomonas oryzae pv. oryzicola]OWB33540.1 hypothetical protein XocBAI21_02695 [Xanthomonas oryzae pv. oryzicola]QEO98647.1 hypothetical protein XOCgx_3658 [Xanthomonas oryzae pv. oryzicola]
MNLSKKSPTKGAASLQRPAGAKGRPEPLDQRLWKHVGGGDYPPSGPNTKHDPPPPNNGHH